MKASTRLDWLREITAPGLFTIEAGLAVPGFPFIIFCPNDRMFIPVIDEEVADKDETEGRVDVLVMLTAVAERVAAILFCALLAANNIAVLASWRVDTGNIDAALDF